MTAQTLPPVAPADMIYGACAIADKLLAALRILSEAKDQRLTAPDSAYGDVHEALIKVLHTQGWRRFMASEAIYYALVNNVCMRAAMLATQTG